MGVVVFMAWGHAASGCTVPGDDSDDCYIQGDCPHDYANDTPYVTPKVPCPNGGDGVCTDDGDARRCEGQYLADSPSGCPAEAPCRLVPTDEGHVQAVCSITEEPCRSVIGDGAECQGNSAVVCLDGYPVGKRDCDANERCIVIDSGSTDGARCVLDAECPPEGSTACYDGLVFVCDSGLSRIVRSCALDSLHCAVENGEGLCALSEQGPRPPGAFRFVPGGELLMARTGNPRVAARVADFEMLEAEVTVGQYAACQEAGRCTPQDEPCRHNVDGGWSSVHADLPARCVSFEQAAAYCAFVDAELPTEIEWEYALRNGGASSLFPWGDAAPTCEHAIVQDLDDGCDRREPWPACSRQDDVTVHGICDLAGNVSEWVKPVVSSIGPEGQRGFSYREPGDALTSQPVPIERGMIHLGFRCVRPR